MDTVWILLTIVHAIEAIGISTVEKLRSQPLVSEDYIAKANRVCDTRRLCTYEEMNVAPICGNDGRTYNSECEIKRAACHGNPVVKQIDGMCPASSKCHLERQFQIEVARRKNATGTFIPECDRKDGSYSIVQCHQLTGYCWCVIKNGQPLPGTSVKNKRPNCLAKAIGKIGRRSSRKRLGRPRKGCTTLDRSTFNNNLLKIFHSEYDREHRNKRKRNTARTDSLFSMDKHVIMWKFDKLDGNSNGKLSRKELRGQKRLIRKLLQPRSCARKFHRYCDLDEDRRIDRREWFTCLGLDISTSYRMLASLDSNRRSSVLIGNSSDIIGGKEISKINKASNSLLTAAGDLRSISQWTANLEQDGNGFYLKEAGKIEEKAVEEELVDCRTQREEMMKSHERNPRSGVYVPTCTGPDDLLYDRVQCHRQTKYCWCVKPETGEPIMYTSRKFKKPNCSQPITRRVTAQIKKCKPRKKAKFYKRFFSTIETEMIVAGANANDEQDDEKDWSGNDQSLSARRKQRAVRWKFRSLDSNKNQIVERREWREYRNQMKKWNRVRRCGRNFFLFCDSNGDKRLTEQEWLSCTVQVDYTFQSRKRNRNQNRNNQNPFLTILKPEG